MKQSPAPLESLQSLAPPRLLVPLRELLEMVKKLPTSLKLLEQLAPLKLLAPPSIPLKPVKLSESLESLESLVPLRLLALLGIPSVSQEAVEPPRW